MRGYIDSKEREYRQALLRAEERAAYERIQRRLALGMMLSWLITLGVVTRWVWACEVTLSR